MFEELRPYLHEAYEKVEYNYVDVVFGDPTDPEFIEDQKRVSRLSKTLTPYIELLKVERDVEDWEDIIEKDPEYTYEAHGEISKLESKKTELIYEILDSFTYLVEDDTKRFYIEIHAGSGGDDAAIFVKELFQMYCKYIEKQKWKADIAEVSYAQKVDGFKSVSILVEGKHAFSHFRFESGVHKVQRVPITETKGRRQTSTVSVAVIPEVEAIQIEIDPKDLKIETCRDSGPGGQHRNVTDSAVKITHIPSKITVKCASKSQHQNRDQAMKILRSRLYAREKAEQSEAIESMRQDQMGGGIRGKSIRTYNYMDNRVTDNRIKHINNRSLDRILNGDLWRLFYDIRHRAIIDIIIKNGVN